MSEPVKLLEGFLSPEKCKTLIDAYKNKGVSIVTYFKTGLLTCCASGTTFQIHTTRFGWDPVCLETAVSNIFIKQ